MSKTNPQVSIETSADKTAIIKLLEGVTVLYDKVFDTL